MNTPISICADEGGSAAHLFSKALDLFQKFDSGDSRDEEQFVNVIQSIERVQQKVASDHLFSSNEPIDEIPTPYLQYLFLPYWSGRTCAKCPVQSQRAAFLNKSNSYLTVYLDKCRSLHLLGEEEVEMIDGAVSDTYAFLFNHHEAILLRIIMILLFLKGYQ